MTNLLPTHNLRPSGGLHPVEIGSACYKENQIMDLVLYTRKTMDLVLISSPDLVLNNSSSSSNDSNDFNYIVKNQENIMYILSKYFSKKELEMFLSSNLSIDERVDILLSVVENIQKELNALNSKGFVNGFTKEHFVNFPITSRYIQELIKQHSEDKPTRFDDLEIKHQIKVLNV